MAEPVDKPTDGDYTDPFNMSLSDMVSNPEEGVQDGGEKETAPEKPSEIGSESVNPNEQKGVEFFQSQADKWAKAYQDSLKYLGFDASVKTEEIPNDMNKLEPLKDVVAIAKYINSQPVDVQSKILNGVQETLQQAPSESAPPKAAPDKPDSSELTRPERPQKPDDYNVLDTSDPESSSYKYDEAMRQYIDDLATYTEKIEERRLEALQRSQAEQAQANEKLRLEHELKTVHGFDEDGIRDFEKTIDHLMNRASLDEFVQIYQLMKAPNKSEMLNRMKEEAMKREAERQTMAPPPDSGGESAKEKPSPDDAFSEDLFSAIKQRRF